MVSFFHIKKGKEMGLCEGENEEKNTAQHRIYKILSITFLSLCMENICMLQNTLMSAI